VPAIAPSRRVASEVTVYSNALVSALEREIVGQPVAVASVVRGATRIASGLTPRERTWAAYMFMGPSGTGKTQLVRTLASTLHGEGSGLYVADCTPYVHADPWSVAQIAPMFSTPRNAGDGWTFEAPPLSILLVEYLERGRKEIGKALTAALDTGRLTLPGGRLGSLNNCLVFITTSLCSREILEESPRIGFQGTGGQEAEADQVLRTCRAQAEAHFGEDLVGRLDSLVVFHRLQDDHMGQILDRRFARMNRWIEDERGFRCELSATARAFVLERGRGDAKLGARELVRAHRRFIEFPLADLMISRRIPAGGLVHIDRMGGDEHLHFDVIGPKPAASGGGKVLEPEMREIAVVRDEPASPRPWPVT
jgi:ATP-dependent Clp protease ATP-binding subunit ClpA